MKRKNFDKKLVLKKATVANLRKQDMVWLQGGVYMEEAFGQGWVEETVCSDCTTTNLDSHCPILTCTCNTCKQVA